MEQRGRRRGRSRGPTVSTELPSEVPPLTNAELVQLQIRVIALENLLTLLLAEATDRQLELAREMAAYISPRPGFTPHRLTVHAAARMISLVERAGHLRKPHAEKASTDRRSDAEPQG